MRLCLASLWKEKSCRFLRSHRAHNCAEIQKMAEGKQNLSGSQVGGKIYQEKGPETGPI